MAEIKQTPTERRALKRREAASKAEAVFGTGKGSAEPKINPLTYQIDLMHALNYYNAAIDQKTKRKWTMAYVGKTSTDFDELSDWEFHSIGTIIRLHQRDVYLEDNEINYIDSRLKEMRQINKDKKAKALAKIANSEDGIVKPIITVKDRAAEAVSNHIGEINCIIDEFIINDTDVDIASYLKSNEVSAQVTKLIPQAFEKQLLELQEVLEGTDKQLVEGYSNIKKVKLKKLIAIYQSINNACQQQTVIVKAARKPRAHKEKPASILASKVKFMKEFTQLGLKSVLPVNIVGSSELWIYNTKYKKLQVYRSLNGTKFSIKGTSILNYEVASSVAKTIRKPELIKDYVNMTKKIFGTEFKSLSTKESAVNGRINEDCIILKVFA